MLPPRPLCLVPRRRYGAPFFNYGMLPRTWEDPGRMRVKGMVGDNDPLDAIEIGTRPLLVGEMRRVKVLGGIELFDQGEVDHKILVIDTSDPQAARLSSAADMSAVCLAPLPRCRSVHSLPEALRLHTTKE